jgi:hypothetical protein
MLNAHMHIFKYVSMPQNFPPTVLISSAQKVGITLKPLIDIFPSIRNLTNLYQKKFTSNLDIHTHTLHFFMTMIAK